MCFLCFCIDAIVFFCSDMSLINEQLDYMSTHKSTQRMQTSSKIVHYTPLPHPPTTITTTTPSQPKLYSSTRDEYIIVLIGVHCISYLRHAQKYTHTLHLCAVMYNNRLILRLMIISLTQLHQCQWFDLDNYGYINHLKPIWTIIQHNK